MAADADLGTVHDEAVKTIITEGGLWELPSGETPVSAAQNTTDEAVASADEGDHFGNQRPLLMATSKVAPRPRPSVNPARVVVATTSSSSSAAAAWTSSMVSDVVRSHEYIDTAASGVDVVGSYHRFLENVLPVGNPQDSDNPQEHEGAGGSSKMHLQEQFEQQLESDADGE